jgi:aminoglycoside phosphotransferase (APT) family kinase protein
VEEANTCFGLPIMIMERVPGRPLVDRFKNPLTLDRAIRAMAALQVLMHRLNAHGCPLPSEPPLIDLQLANVLRDIERFGLRGLDEAYRWLDERRHIVEEEEISLLHNDFHPLNIMASGEAMWVLDWTDAALGDRHHDLARTLAIFHLAPPLARSRLERFLLATLRRYIVPRYLARYRASLPVDPARLRRPECNKQPNACSTP